MPTTIKNYREPNFVGDNGRLYLVRCYACQPKMGRENWAPAVASGQCAWCGWEYDERMADAMILFREKRGMTLEEIKRAYPEQYQKAINKLLRTSYTPYDQEDDGEID